MRPAGFLAELFERLLKPLDPLVGLFEMDFKAGDEITVGRLVDHLLGVVDVLQTMDQQIFHRFYVLGEDFPFDLSFYDGNGTPSAAGCSIRGEPRRTGMADG